jgi:amino acid adenylation domain-containing protein
MVLGIVATLKAGAAYVPIDPDYPFERLRYMLAEAKPAVVIAQEKFLARLPECNVLAVETALVGQTSTPPFGNLPARPAGDDLAYVIYTSGSTGHPKGAMNTHGAIRNRLLWMQAEYALTPGDRLLQKTTYGFDVSVWEFLWPLMFGATLVIAEPGGHQDSAYLADVIRAERITVMHFVPSMLQVFLEEAGASSCTSLREVICSGEALPAALQRRFFATLPSARLENLYGPTEAAVDVTYWPCSREDAGDVVPIGRPIANVRIHILDGSLRPVPCGVAGELYIAGAGLARGYLNQPALTAEKFIADPFSGRPGARMYRSGDLARWRADGSIEYLGRIDHQVKIRGFRIELGEVEAVLAEVPAVRDVVVVARRGAEGDKRLVAYAAPREGAQLTASDLRNAAREKLPDYMVPAAFVLLPALPLNANGKVDRKALPSPEVQSVRAAYVPLQSESERIVASVWQSVLGVGSVGVEDNFFDLGGHSLLMVRVRTMLREALKREVTMIDLFRHTTVGALARHLGEADSTHQRLQNVRERAQRQRQAMNRRKPIRETERPQ